LGLGPRKCTSIPGAMPGRGVIHPASLSEAGRNDPLLSTSKPLPPHSPSGLDRLRNAPGFHDAIPGPSLDATQSREILCILRHLRADFAAEINSIFFRVPFWCVIPDSVVPSRFSKRVSCAAKSGVFRAQEFLGLVEPQNGLEIGRYHRGTAILSPLIPIT
jgi:hypothetical protein